MLSGCPLVGSLSAQPEKTGQRESTTQEAERQRLWCSGPGDVGLNVCHRRTHHQFITVCEVLQSVVDAIDCDVGFVENDSQITGWYPRAVRDDASTERSRRKRAGRVAWLSLIDRQVERSRTGKRLVLPTGGHFKVAQTIGKGCRPDSVYRQCIWNGVERDA